LTPSAAAAIVVEKQQQAQKKRRTDDDASSSNGNFSPYTLFALLLSGPSHHGTPQCY